LDEMEGTKPENNRKTASYNSSVEFNFENNLLKEVGLIMILGNSGELGRESAGLWFNRGHINQAPEIINLRNLF